MSNSLIYKEGRMYAALHFRNRGYHNPYKKGFDGEYNKLAKQDQMNWHRFPLVLASHEKWSAWETGYASGINELYCLIGRV